MGHSLRRSRRRRQRQSESICCSDAVATFCIQMLSTFCISCWIDWHERLFLINTSVFLYCKSQQSVYAESEPLTLTCRRGKRCGTLKRHYTSTCIIEMRSAQCCIFVRTQKLVIWTRRDLCYPWSSIHDTQRRSTGSAEYRFCSTANLNKDYSFELPVFLSLHNTQHCTDFSTRLHNLAMVVAGFRLGKGANGRVRLRPLCIQVVNFSDQYFETWVKIKNLALLRFFPGVTS